MTLTLHTLPQLISYAFEKGDVSENIISGFRNTGIFSLDRHAIPDDKFLLSFSTDRPMSIEEPVGQSQPQVSCEEGQETSAAKDAPIASTSGITPASKQSF